LSWKVDDSFDVDVVDVELSDCEKNLLQAL